MNRFLAQTGAGWGVGAQHNHNLEAWFAHSPGLKVAMPSTAADVQGLLKTAIRDDNPVLLLLDMTLGYHSGEVPAGEVLVPLGRAQVLRSGTDVTLVSYSKSVYTCLQAAAALEQQGLQAEVLDLRSIKPLDSAAIVQSVQRTGRLVVVHEAGAMCGVGAEVAAQVAEQAYRHLRAPIRRITSPDVPAPASYVLEQAFMPQVAQVVAAAQELCAWA